MSTNELIEKVNVKVYNRVATVEMYQSEVLNGFDKELLKDLVSKLKEISESDEIDIVVLTGTEGIFPGSYDSDGAISPTGRSDFSEMMDYVNELIVTLYGMSKLTISAVSRSAVGLGLSLALATDYIIADSSSRFAMNFIDVGLIPDGGAHFFLVKRIGETRAKQLIWEGKFYDAREALKLGLIQEIAEGDLSSALEARISDWLQRPIQAMIRTKKILAETNRPQLLKVLELEKLGQFKMRETADHREGVQAFREHREPRFIGK